MEEWVSRDGMGPLIIVISLFIVLENAFEIFLIVREKHEITAYEQFLLSLSVADLLVGLSYACLVALYMLKWDVMENSGGRESVAVWYSVMVSLLHISGITADRLLAVLWPIKHKIYMTRKNVAYSIALLWLMALPVIPLTFTIKTELVEVVLGYICIDCGLIILISYTVIIYKTVVIRRRTLASEVLSSQRIARMKREVNLLIMCVMITLSFAALNMPFAAMVVAQTEENLAVNLALISNSLVNPTIYFFWKYLERRVKRARVNLPAENATSRRDAEKKDSEETAI